VSSRTLNLAQPTAPQQPLSQPGTPYLEGVQTSQHQSHLVIAVREYYSRRPSLTNASAVACCHGNACGSAGQMLSGRERWWWVGATEIVWLDIVGPAWQGWTMSDHALA